MGGTSLLAAVLLLWAIFDLSQGIDRTFALLAKHAGGEDLGKATASVAIVLALRATLGMLSGVFGAYQVISTLLYWRGRPGHLAVSAIIAKDFGISGEPSTLPTNTVQPSLSRAALRIRALAGAAIALGAGAYLVWKGDSLDRWPALLLLAMVLAGACYYVWNRYVMSFY
ncbi:MAG: hypothetical protein ACHQ4J_12715 [Candidatus Binatia bacterium]